MIVTQTEARNIIRSTYGSDFKFRLTIACTIGVRPVHQTNIGMLTLAWRKLAVDSFKGRKGNCPSAVKIGRVLPGGAIDWDIVFKPTGGHWFPVKIVPELTGTKMPNGLGDYHGSAYDRGGADAYYSRPKNPHYYPCGTYNGQPVTALTAAELHAYNLGYDSCTDRK